MVKHQFPEKVVPLLLLLFSALSLPLCWFCTETLPHKTIVLASQIAGIRDTRQEEVMHLKGGHFSSTY